MNYNDVRKNEDKGFSLVELIVVIAIMAVMVAVLAPSLLSYVEKSRAQKDDSAMGEVVNAIQIAMSEENVFNEVLAYSRYGNYSCYVDDTAQDPNKGEDGKKGLAAYYVETKAKNEKASTEWGKEAQWMFDDESRRDDEVPYHPAGAMRGVTLTFIPEKNKNGNFTYEVKNAVVNDMASATSKIWKSTDSDTPSLEQPRQIGTVVEKGEGKSAQHTADEDITDGGKGQTLKVMTASKRGDNYLYNAVKGTVGDSIDLSSKTYRNSEFTVFIRIGSVGGKSSGGDSIKVYGQWNGTNLSSAAVTGG